MGIHVTDRTDESARSGHEQVVVAAHDPEPAGMGEGVTIGDTACCGQDVAVVHDDTIAVDGEGRVNGAGGWELAIGSRSTTGGEGSDAFAAVGAYNKDTQLVGV